MDIITTENMHKYSPQQVFDYVVEHLYKQGKPSARNGFCAYRGDNGLKCAAGILISDKIYDPSWDKNSTNYETLKAKGLVPSDHMDLIESLQRVHDNWYVEGSDLDCLADGLRTVSSSFKLKFDASKYE